MRCRPRENCYKLKVRRPPEEETEVSRDFVTKLTEGGMEWGKGMQWGQTLDFVGENTRDIIEIGHDTNDG